MNPPPSTLDGASVLCYATTAGLPLSPACTFHRDGQLQTTFAALAIAQYDADPNCYLFLCNDHWQTQNDTLHPNPAAAKAFAESLYPGLSTRWRATP